MDTKTRLKRYYMMLRIFLYADGYDRGKYLKMNKYFKNKVSIVIFNHGILAQSLI